MRKTLLGLLFLPLIVSNNSQVETTVKTEVPGENASAHTEITNIVNDKETKVESDQPGEIKIEVKDGEVKVESSQGASPTITTGEAEKPEAERIQDRTFRQVEEMRNKVVDFMRDLFAKIIGIFGFSS
jgi:hypothetical protein